MGIFDWAKGQLIDVIEWQDQSSDTIVHQFERHNNEIKNGAQLIVRESQVAVFIHEGELGDVFQPGRYELTTNNIPVLTSLQSWKYGLNSPFKCEVYFVNTKIFPALKWGTPNVFYLRDQDFGRVTVRAFGTYSMRVVDAGAFIQKVSGTKSTFRTSDLSDELRSMIITNLIDTIGESKLSLLDYAQNYKDLSEKCEQRINKEFPEYGIEYTKFLISSISLPEELQKKLDEGTGMNMIGNMNTYSQMKAADAMTAAANNPRGVSGGMEGMMGMAMMQNMMNQNMMMNQNLANQQNSGQVAPPPIPNASQYYLAVNGQQQGPFAIAALQQLVANGQLTPTTMVWKNGMANWAAANTVDELSGLFGAVPPPIPQ